MPRLKSGLWPTSSTLLDVPGTGPPSATVTSARTAAGSITAAAASARPARKSFMGTPRGWWDLFPACRAGAAAGSCHPGAAAPSAPPLAFLHGLAAAAAQTPRGHDRGDREQHDERDADDLD